MKELIQSYLPQDEANYWIDMLPIMTQEQQERLLFLIVELKNKLDELNKNILKTRYERMLLQ